MPIFRNALNAINEPSVVTTDMFGYRGTGVEANQRGEMLVAYRVGNDKYLVGWLHYGSGSEPGLVLKSLKISQLSKEDSQAEFTGHIPEAILARGRIYGDSRKEVLAVLSDSGETFTLHEVANLFFRFERQMEAISARQRLTRVSKEPIGDYVRPASARGWVPPVFAQN